MSGVDGVSGNTEDSKSSEQGSSPCRPARDKHYMERVIAQLELNVILTQDLIKDLRDEYDSY